MSELSPYALAPAELDWQGETPLSPAFDDIYFSRAQGLAETTHVFLQGNRLAERFAALRPGGQFTVAETGFGTGLNFLACAALWQRQAPADCWLDFLSVEKHPLSLPDLRRSLAAVPTLQDLTEQLLDHYPPLIPGHHYRLFAGLRIRLHLVFAEAEEGLAERLVSRHPHLAGGFGARVDAWFLDGFAPAKNPQMWCDGLYRRIAQLSRPGTTLATFTAAGAVRRGLAATGFAMKKIPGFGSKREMLVGEWQACCLLDRVPDRQHGWPIAPPPAAGERRVAIIGAGLAGCCSAFSLARRGWEVTLLEAGPTVAGGASGNDQGMLYTRLSRQRGALSDFSLFSYLFALHWYRELRQQGWLQAEDLDFCGLLQLGLPAAELANLQQCFASLPALVDFPDPAAASALAGITISQPGLFLPGSGWVSPRRVCEQLGRHPNIRLLTGHRVTRLTREDTGWQLQGELPGLDGHFPVVVIANSYLARQFAQTADLPLKTIRGQVSHAISSPQSASLRTVVCHDGYLTPAIQGQHALGATFDPGDENNDWRAEDQQRNWQSLEQALPGLLSPDALVGGRAGIRCNSPDYLPLVGPVADRAAMAEAFAGLARNARHSIASPGHYHPGLYASLAYGARGLTAIPLCSELLASQIAGEPPPVPQTLVNALHPARFVIRGIIRGTG